MGQIIDTTEEGTDGSQTISNNRQGSLELLRVKILLLGSEDSPAAVRMELSSETGKIFITMSIF